jgi:hypothetical protein
MPAFFLSKRKLSAATTGSSPSATGGRLLCLYLCFRSSSLSSDCGGDEKVIKLHPRVFAHYLLESVVCGGRPEASKPRRPSKRCGILSLDRLGQHHLMLSLRFLYGLSSILKYGAANNLFLPIPSARYPSAHWLYCTLQGTLWT